MAWKSSPSGKSISQYGIFAVQGHASYRAFLESHRELGSTRPFLVITAEAGIQGETWIPDQVGDDRPRANLDYSCYNGLVRNFDNSYIDFNNVLVTTHHRDGTSQQVRKVF